MQLLRHARMGLFAGVFFGIVYAWADTLLTYLLLRYNVGLPFPPFTFTTLRLASMSLAMSVALGLLLGVVGGRWLAGKPRHFLIGLGALWFGVATIASPEFDRIYAMGLAGVILGLGASIALLQLRKRRFAVPGAMAGMGLAWYLILGYGIAPTPARPDDPSRPRPAATAPNVLLIVYDTTRADRLSAYGHDKNTSPIFDQLASEGALFEKAYSTSSWTLASHASMFTGLYSAQNNCHSTHLLLTPTFKTLAEHLYGAGYRTALFSGNPWLDDYTGLARGFSVLHPSWRNYTLGNLFVIGRFEILFFQGGQDKGARESGGAFDEWWKETVKDSRPFFAVINYLEPHNPYHQVPDEDRDRFLPPGSSPDEAVDIAFEFNNRIMYANDYEPDQRATDILLSVYDGGIHNVDRRVGEILETLRDSGKLDDTLVILAGDHGEMFGEHGVFAHEHHLYYPLLHVPLAMRWPGHVPPGTRVKEPVELNDVYPTILEAAGLSDASPDVRARSLEIGLSGAGDASRAVFAEVYPSHLKPIKDEVKKWGYDPAKWKLTSVIQGPYQLIRFPNGDRLWDIGTDPGQKLELSKERPEEAERLGRLVDAFLAVNRPLTGTATGPMPEIDAATKEQLKNLGYVIEDDKNAPKGSSQ